MLDQSKVCFVLSCACVTKCLIYLESCYYYLFFISIFGYVLSPLVVQKDIQENKCGEDTS
jgi:hypothetical protein